MSAAAEPAGPIVAITRTIDIAKRIKLLQEPELSNMADAANSVQL